jgi:hypothetical protein
MVDEAFGYKSERRGTYTVVVTRTVEQSITIEVEASSEDEARENALDEASGRISYWKEMDAYDYEVESVVEPEDEERDPDDARDARIDYLMDRDR